MFNQIEHKLSQCLNKINQFIKHNPEGNNLKPIEKLHARLIRTGLLFTNHTLHAKLIFSYTNCLKQNNTRLQNFTYFFKFLRPIDPIPFNILISEFSRNGFGLYALKTFSYMHMNDVALDTYALCGSLRACCCSENFNLGKQMHSLVFKLGCCSSVYLGSALIDLYAKFSCIYDAANVFDKMCIKNTICANAMLSGYADAKMWFEGLDLVRNMPHLELEYDHVTFSAILRLCTGLSTVELGRQVHGCLIRRVYDVGSDVFLQSSLIEMYGKCGLVRKAGQVFDLAGNKGEDAGKRDLILWTSMLGVYGRNGYYKEVIEFYKEMLAEGIEPDEIAFLSVISACARTGQVELGIGYFELMTCGYRLSPSSELYSCLVDLLSRAGELNKAWKLVNEMLRNGFRGKSSMWGALLNACVDYGNIELGELAAQQALHLDPQSVGIYTLLSNLYARFGMWEKIGRLRDSAKLIRLQKDTGCSWIDITP